MSTDEIVFKAVLKKTKITCSWNYQLAENKDVKSCGKSLSWREHCNSGRIKTFSTQNVKHSALAAWLTPIPEFSGLAGFVVF